MKGEKNIKTKESLNSVLRIALFSVKRLQRLSMRQCEL